VTRVPTTNYQVQLPARSQQQAASSRPSEVQAAASAAACFPGSHPWLNPSLFAKRENGFRSLILQVNDQIPNTKYQLQEHPAQFLWGCACVVLLSQNLPVDLNPETDSRLLTLERRRKMLCARADSTASAMPATTK
jgi:hypothetical protein